MVGKTNYYRGSRVKRRTSRRPVEEKSKNDTIDPPTDNEKGDTVKTPSPKKLVGSIIAASYPHDGTTQNQSNATSITPPTKNTANTYHKIGIKPHESNTGNLSSRTTTSNPFTSSKLPDPSLQYVPSTNGNDTNFKSTFLLQKEINDCSDVYDEDTSTQNHVTNKEFCNSVRMTMMFKIPSETEGCSTEEAPLIAIKKMNDMLKALSNKLPCRVGPWLNVNIKTGELKSKDLLKTLPEDVDFVESYVYDYNRFIQPGKNGYVRLLIFYSDRTSVQEISSVVSQFKTPRERFFDVAHSNATNPVHIGCLTGSVNAMAESQDFYRVMKKKSTCQNWVYGLHSPEQTSRIMTEGSSRFISR